MNELYKILPKDLVSIIEDYAKDRMRYNNIMQEFTKEISKHLEYPWHCIRKQSIYNTYYLQMHDLNHLNIVNYMLLIRRQERKRRFNEWYAQLKILHKPHGKRPPTIKNRYKKHRNEEDSKRYKKYLR